MNAPVIVIGAGGHAMVVADALLRNGRTVLGFTDRDPARHGATLCGLRVLGGAHVPHDPSLRGAVLANGIGGVGRADDCGVREKVETRLTAQGWTFEGVTHPSATVSPFAEVHSTAQLLAGAIVQAGARIGRGSIVNTAAVVEHDTSIGDWCHVAPRAVVCGAATVAPRCHVGAGAVVLQGLTLGNNTVVGAGAVVVKNPAEGSRLVGVPARPREQKL